MHYVAPFINATGNQQLLGGPTTQLERELRLTLHRSIEQDPARLGAAARIDQGVGLGDAKPDASARSGPRLRHQLVKVRRSIEGQGLERALRSLQRVRNRCLDLSRRHEVLCELLRGGPASFQRERQTAVVGHPCARSEGAHHHLANAVMVDLQPIQLTKASCAHQRRGKQFAQTGERVRSERRHSKRVPEVDRLSRNRHQLEQTPRPNRQAHHPR